MHVKTQPDNTSLGMVKVPSIEEARFAISQFHRKKIGYKRIHVTLKNEETQRPASSTRLACSDYSLQIIINKNILLWSIVKFRQLTLS